MRISDWSSDVCSSDLRRHLSVRRRFPLGRRDAHSDRSFARHAHDTFGIGLITEGAQRSWSGRGAVEAACGQLITVNPGDVHDGNPVGPAPSWSMLYLSPRLVGDIIDRKSTRLNSSPYCSSPMPSSLLKTTL